MKVGFMFAFTINQARNEIELRHFLAVFKKLAIPCSFCPSTHGGLKKYLPTFLRTALELAKMKAKFE
jgi:hypothetical protein